MNYIEDLEHQITKNNLNFRHKGKILTGWHLEYDKIKNPNISTVYAEQFMVKNRYSNILPYDDNRVKISDYINASWVNDAIATQWPKINTLNDFWEMILVHHISVIIALNNIEREDQCVYWECEYVKVLDIIYHDDFIIRTLQVTFQNNIKNIKHYQYIAWPDFKCPMIASLLKMIDIINADKGIKCIHCSAGVGRTGTFMTIDYCLNKINNNESFNIVETIKLLRSQRLSMVQTKEQFSFCYYSVLYYLQL